MIIKQKNEDYYSLQNSRSGGDLDNNILNKNIGKIDFQKDKNNIYIIDIGCRGHAGAVKRLINLGFVNTFGIDIGERAEQQWDNHSFKNNLKRFDVHNGIPFDFNFDLISCSHTLEHCHNPKLVIDVIYNKLNEGGYYWGQVPLGKSEDTNNHTPHYCYFESHDDHLNFIKSNKFEIIFDIKETRQSILLAKKV